MSSSSGTTADIIILGAGVMGASIAFHLAQRGAGHIVVLDKDHAGQGSSSRSSALVRMHYSFPPEVELAVKSLEMFQSWKELLGRESHFRKTGFIRIVPENEMDRLEANVEMQRACGANVEILERRALEELEPDWNFGDVPAAAYEPDSGYSDGYSVANDFIEAARQLGVDYRPRTQATQLVIAKDRARGVMVGGDKIEAPVVIAATGVWSRPLFTQAGIELPIENEFHQVAILRNPPNMQGHGNACIDSTTTTYFRTEGRGRMLLGDFYGDPGADPDRLPDRVSGAWLEKIVTRASRRIPKLENAEILRGITGVYDMTPDARPIMGAITAIDGLYVCAGFSGMGFKISPAVGLAMSELVLDGRSKTTDIAAFRPSRFAEGAPIKAQFEYSDDIRSMQ